MLELLKKHKYKLAWLGILGGGVLGFELFTIFNGDTGDTLSEQVWGLMDLFATLGTSGKFLTAGFSIGVLGLFGWLGFHWFGRKKV